MTKQADLKRRVRARMAKTGESYSAARAQVVADRATGESSAWARVLHVTNGDATVPGLRGTGLARSILTWRDVLHEGPVPDVPDAELRRIRARFLEGETRPTSAPRQSSPSVTGCSPSTARASTCFGSRPISTTRFSSCRSSPGWASWSSRRTRSH